MGKKGGETTQKTENSPPAWATPLFKQSASEAQKIYDSGAGGNVYQGQTVAGLGNTTQQGIKGISNTVAGLPSSTSAQNNLTDYASGKFLAEGNPYYKERLNNEINDSNSLIQSQFSGSGRYGSGANTGVLAKNTNNMLLQGLENDYNRQQANQFAATSQIDAANSNLYQNQLAGNQAQIGAGQLQDANKQAQLTADFTKWQSEDMKPWTRLGLLQSAAAGSAGNYGTNTQTQTQPFNAMQGLGALGSLFTKSDARLKENIVPIGVRDGHVVYEWNYIGGDAIFRGVMAQDLLNTDAVVMDTDGFYAVNYAKVGFPMERVN
jgi:hypothetical protein